VMENAVGESEENTRKVLLRHQAVESITVPDVFDPAIRQSRAPWFRI
jgi:hypothetical protein